MLLRHCHLGGGLYLRRRVTVYPVIDGDPIQECAFIQRDLQTHWADCISDLFNILLWGFVKKKFEKCTNLWSLQFAIWHFDLEGKSNPHLGPNLERVTNEMNYTYFHLLETISLCQISFMETRKMEVEVGGPHHSQGNSLSHQAVSWLLVVLAVTSGVFHFLIQ